MAIRTVEPKHVTTCDVCGVEHMATSAGRPSGWARLILEQAAEDYQGTEVADATIRRDLCRQCKIAVITAINKVKEAKPNDT